VKKVTEIGQYLIELQSTKDRYV